LHRSTICNNFLHGRGRGEEEGRVGKRKGREGGEEALLVMWSTKLSALNAPLCKSLLVLSLFHVNSDVASTFTLSLPLHQPYTHYHLHNSTTVNSN